MGFPDPQLYQHTLYHPSFEHDGCGIGFVARIDGAKSHDILAMALTGLGNLGHRGAVAADARSGDGAGVLTQIPYAFFRRELGQALHGIPDEALAAGMLFLPRQTPARRHAEQLLEAALAAQDLYVLAWRDVPTDDAALGARAVETRPAIRQALVGAPGSLHPGAFERALYVARKQFESATRQAGLADVYVASLSSRTLVYKGMLTGPLLASFYPDLRDPHFATALAVYHQRYSTNTFPTWDRAQPFRMLSHNGEINTLQGNVNWMRAREHLLPPEFRPVFHDETGSDSMLLDNALELLVLGGRTIAHALTMLVPEAWEKVPDLPEHWRAFYQYHSCLVEPWDGPAALTFSDGRFVGTTLDRNGLRPARFVVTDEGLVISGSEVGAIPVSEERIVHKGRLGPGQMILVDTVAARLYTNEDIKDELSTDKPYAAWVAEHLQILPAVSATPGTPALAEPGDQLLRLQQLFGYTSEDLNVVVKPMMRDGQEPVGSMGDDTPVAVLTHLEIGRPLFHFFKQRFAEVTNPPIDPLREELVMSLSTALGRRGSILDETAEQAHLLRLTSPVLNDAQLAAIRELQYPRLRSATIPAVMPPDVDGAGLREALRRLCRTAEAAARGGAGILVISDRALEHDQAPIPIMLALGAVHHHLIRTGLRTVVSLIVESGEPREVHHLACLVGYGAEGVNPYLALASARAMAREIRETKERAGGPPPVAPRTGQPPHPLTIEEEAERNFVQALEKGLLKVMSKMGISTLDSYCGAQIFEVLGFDDEVITTAFAGTPSRLSGIGMERIAQDVRTRYQRAAAQPPTALSHPGMYKFKRGGEYHSFSPQVVHALHGAVMESPEGAYAAPGSEGWEAGYERYRRYSELLHTRAPAELRDLLAFRPAGRPVPLGEVEPIEAIVRRFSTAAMSHGSTSSEAHETLSIAMNRLGGMSNSGEGGEAPERYKDERNSRIKQVASGRFGVTPTYLTAASELQIKMAQGSKPGEGGQLPGHKVTAEIAQIRHTTPGVALISPPPHHDIYSIEDLAQLIYDLKQANPQASISVKLVSEAGVGTVAAGVAKGYADVVLISGHNGGTGASPLSSIKGAGTPWELGLAETQQTLVLNDLRGRVRVRVDGGLKTGRDVLIAALLGADEFSFGTAALVAEGCLMARACHTNTCPVGIATQRADLRARFPGKPEMVMAFFRYVAHEVRELLATLGLRSLDEAIGRTELLYQRTTGHAAADALNLGAVLGAADLSAQLAARRGEPPVVRAMGHANGVPAEQSLNERILRNAGHALSGRGPITQSYPISNSDRTVGARLSGAIAQMYGAAGLPPGTITLKFRGSAGQSFGAFNAPGVQLLLSGDANDYVGKGMAGGLIVINPPEQARYSWHENAIIGNTVLYGATGGELYAAGRAGERFGVRNSGAVAVVEGLGDHGCEYMTGGMVVVLGEIGRNFGAGMTGGVAYVLNEDGMLARRVNMQLVQMNELNSGDEAQVLRLLRRHVDLTGSPRVLHIIQRWEIWRPLFRRVMPREAVARIENAAEGTHEEPTGGKSKRVAA